jgi:hypothetical protein
MGASRQLYKDDYLNLPNGLRDSVLGDSTRQYTTKMIKVRPYDPMIQDACLRCEGGLLQ